MEFKVNKIRLLLDKEKLDKENASLKKNAKINEEDYKTCKLFLKSFAKEIKDVQDKSKKLKLENIALRTKTSTLKNDKEVNDESGNSHEEYGNQLRKVTCYDSCTDIKYITRKGLLYFHSSIILYLVLIF